MNDRGRQRSSAQKAGTSYAYLRATEDLTGAYDPTYTMQNGVAPPRRRPPGPLKYPPYSDVNLLWQSEDEIRAGLFYRDHNAYARRLNPITYIEKQLGPYDV